MDQVLEEKVNTMARRGLRTLAYAYKDIDFYAWEDMKRNNNNFLSESDRENIENEFIFVGAFGLEDELKDGVTESIRQLRAGEVNIRMLSGDNLYTAIECAKKAGILKEGDERQDKVCLTGKEFKELIGGVKRTIDKEGKQKYEIINKTNFRGLLSKLKVLARTTPEDKFAMTVFEGLKGSKLKRFHFEAYHVLSDKSKDVALEAYQENSWR